LSTKFIAGVGFEPTTSRLCIPATAFTALFLKQVCGLDFLFAIVEAYVASAVGACH